MPPKTIQPIEQQTYTVSRYEQTGDQLFIRLESTNNPVYLEHFFTADEQQDIPTTMIDLVAQLQILDDNYVAPIPVVSLMDSIPAQVDMSLVATKKTNILQIRQEAVKSVIDTSTSDVAPVEETLSSQS